MEAGRKRHTVIVQSPSGATDTAGDHVTVWTDVLRWRVSIESLSVREQFESAQEHASATHRITGTWRRALAAMEGSWRILYGTRVFVLVGLPTNLDNERNRDLELLCVEGLRQE